MQTKESVRLGNHWDEERNEELIGVLTAISIVSKRLAQRLKALENSRLETVKGGKTDDTGQSYQIR